MTALLLATLCLVDGTLCGFRAAAGRNPRISLGAYYRAAMARGAALALAVLLLFATLAWAMTALGGDGQWRALLEVGARMVVVYGTFATLTLGALALYLVGSFDFGVLASVLVLGPFTLLRPWCIAGGALFAAAGTSEPLAACFALAAGAVMWGFERLLDVGRPPWRGLEGDRRAAK